MLPQGFECIEDRCTFCTACPPGKYKDSKAPIPCRNCAAGKYNKNVEATSDGFCVACPEASDTRGVEGAVSLEQCTCASNMYMSLNKTDAQGQTVMRCFKCPPAAMCTNGACGFRNAGFLCEGVGADVKPKVVGTWARGDDEKYYVTDCPTGHRMINNTGYELQECSQCPEGKYVSVNNNPAYKCWRCPPSAVCPDRGRPVFPAAELECMINMTGPLAARQDLQLSLVNYFGYDSEDLDMIKLIDYDLLLEGQDARRRRQFYRRVNEVVTLFFRVFSTSKDQAAAWLDQYPGPSAFPDLTDVLESISGNRTAQAIATGCYGIRQMLEGEIWTEENGIFFIKQCPLGFLIVNGSIDTQECTECLAGSYSLSSTYGCVDKVWCAP